MIRGSCFDFVHRVRSGHGVQCFRANRASKAIPLGGYVLGHQEILLRSTKGEFLAGLSEDEAARVRPRAESWSTGPSRLG